MVGRADGWVPPAHPVWAGGTRAPTAETHTLPPTRTPHACNRVHVLPSCSKMSVIHMRLVQGRSQLETGNSRHCVHAPRLKTPETLPYCMCVAHIDLQWTGSRRALEVLILHEKKAKAVDRGGDGECMGVHIFDDEYSLSNRLAHARWG